MWAIERCLGLRAVALNRALKRLLGIYENDVRETRL